MSEFKIEQASRANFVPLIALYALGGRGKTMSGLILCRGFVGPKGKIVMVDTENRRGSLYAGVDPIGEYLVINLDQPFTSDRYIEALTFAFSQRPDIVMLDSGSHEWEGIGGVLDQAGENEERSKKAGLHNWKTPKMNHSKLLGFLQRAPVPVVICVRAKCKSRQGKDENGKTVIYTDDQPSPIQSEDFLFDVTVHGLIDAQHCCTLTKVSHPGLKACFPDTPAPINIEVGQKIAQWCKAGNQTSPRPTEPAKAVSEPLTEVDKLKKELWTITKNRHGGKMAVLVQWLVDECILDPADMQLETKTAPELSAIIAAVKKKLTP